MGKLHIRPHDINTKSKLFRFFDAHQDSTKIDMWNNMNRHCLGNLSRSIAREKNQKCSRRICQLMAIGSGAYQESKLSNRHYGSCNEVGSLSSSHVDSTEALDPSGVSLTRQVRSLKFFSITRKEPLHGSTSAVVVHRTSMSPSSPSSQILTWYVVSFISKIWNRPRKPTSENVS